MTPERDALARDAIRALSSRLDMAAARVPTVAQRYRIAGACVAIHTTRDSDAQRLLAACAPLRTEADDAAPVELDLYVWNGATDGVALPESDVLRRTNAPEDGLGGFSDAASNAFYQPDAGVLSILDIAGHRAHWWLDDIATAPYYERAAPFRHILQWWIASRGGALLHSAAIGCADAADRRGVLISGPSGSGKSSTALACLGEGFGFASDDYVLVGAEPSPTVHLAYSTAKVLRASLDRHRAYAGQFRNLANTDEKPMMFVHEFAPHSVRTSFSPIALVTPRVAHAPRTHFVPISPATMLRALAPSSVLLFPLAGGRAFKRMARLCASLPCYRAELADDPRDVARAFGELLGEPVFIQASAVA
jgi:hypothetical protein